MPSITVLVVDDQEDIRFLVRAVIAAENHGLEVADEAASGEEALAFFADHEVSVVVIDQAMPGMTGTETARALLAQRPGQKIILFSAYLDGALRAEAEAIGISACVDKAEYNTVARTVRRVAMAA